MKDERAEPLKASEEPPRLVPAATESSSGEVGPLSPEQITEVVREVIRRVAEEELPVFDIVADAWRADGRQQWRSGRPPGASVGFGVDELLLTQLAFPVIAAALGEVLGDAAEERGRAWMKRRAKRPPAVPEGKPAETEAQQRNGAPARGSLTIQQAEAVRDACERYARTLGMKADKSELLAKAVLGSLTETDGG
jgi:hypothetical protein